MIRHNPDYVVLSSGEGRKLAARTQLLSGLGRCVVVEHVIVDGGEVRRDVYAGSVILEPSEFQRLVEEFGPLLEEEWREMEAEGDHLVCVVCGDPTGGSDLCSICQQDEGARAAYTAAMMEAEDARC